MRIIVAVVALLSLLPGSSFADQIYATAAESRIEYGSGDAYHEGFSFYDLDINGVDVQNFSDAYFEARSGPLFQHVLTANGSGEVVSSTYLYDGGTFSMDFDFLIGGQQVTWNFSAPIVGPMTVDVGERPEENDDDVQVSFSLGPGLFDAQLAKALGVRRHTLSGYVNDPFLIFGDGDHTSPFRTAWEGAPDVYIDVEAVPEPASMVLLGAGVVGWLVRRLGTRRV